MNRISPEMVWTEGDIVPGSFNFGAVDKTDAEDVCWCFVESIASIDDTASNLVSAVHFLGEAYGAEEADEKVIPNPTFLANGHDGLSPRTRKYFTGRTFKGLSGSVVRLAGGLASGVSALRPMSRQPSPSSASG